MPVYTLAAYFFFLLMRISVHYRKVAFGETESVNKTSQPSNLASSDGTGREDYQMVLNLTRSPPKERGK
jgi:hypothetical protein